MEARYDLRLGYKARDVVTGFSGTIMGLVTYLTGCKQALLVPGLDEKGQPGESHWFDLDRLQILAEEPHLAPDKFGKIAEVIGVAARTIRAARGPDKPAPKR